MNTPASLEPDAPTCWVVSDGRRGIENQALGLAEAAARINPLSIECRIIENAAAFKAASPRLQFALKSKPQDYGLLGPLPDFVIGCGRQAIAPLMAIKKTAPHVLTAYIQDPHLAPANFDVVFAPQHDQLTAPNVEVMIGSPNRVTRDLIIAETLKFAEQLSQLPMPRAALLVGGTSKTHKLNKASHAEHLNAAKEALQAGYSLMITPSRRTPDWAIADYKRLESDYDNVWLYTGEGANPYYAFLGGAECILVTEESTNMLTEACATGKPVYRLPMSGKAGKFQMLYDALENRCGVSQFSGSYDGADYAPLDETARMAQQFWAHVESRAAVIN